MNMKLFKIYIISLVTMAMIVACTDEWDLQKNNFIREGVPVTVSLDFGVSASKIASRAAESETTERTVNRVYLFVFNSDGSLDNKQLFTINSSTESCITSVTSFSMHSGYDKRFYAIANPTSGSGTLGANELARIESEDELLEQTSSLLIPTNIERSYFLMSGKMELASGSTQINVDEHGNIQGAETCTHDQPVIELERVDARITFKIKGAEGLNFIPDRYWVENIPQHTYVFPHDEDYTEENGLNYVSMSDEEYDVQRNVEGQDESGNYIFEFYLAENRLSPKKNITDTDANKEVENLYALREKREKETGIIDPNKPGKEEENGEFEYANLNSTYVVFHGTLSYFDNEKQRYVYADSEYTVHLGSTGGSSNWNDPEYVNNYRTERNTHYTYTVEIAGVEKMRVEVQDDREEQRPGVEGDVIFSGEAVAEMDAHYGRTRFVLNKQDILRGLSWAVRTPLQSGMKAFNTKQFVENNNNVSTDRNNYTLEQWESLQTDLNLNDYKWVQFVINREAGYIENDDFAKYPGYQSYTGSDPNDPYQPAPPFGGEGANPEWTEYPANGKVVMYDANQLVNHLYAEAKRTNPASSIFDRNGDVIITAFVDEYVYVYDPREVYYRSPLTVKTDDKDVNLQLWKDVVNRDNRMLYLCTTGAIYSPDGETSVSDNVFTITQKPIYTFFNENDDAITEAWGTESINETGPISPYPSAGESYGDLYINENANGLPNTRNVLYNSSNGARNLNWDDLMYLDNSREPNNDGTLQLKENRNNIWYACIARNRDLNGNNIVDEDEIRWYLASIDQLTDIWIGQWSLNESAWLYHGTGNVRSHVASSTYYVGGNTETGSPNNPFVIWAEEGASRGALSSSTGYNGEGTNNTTIVDADKFGNSRRYHYRCVRNLGISLEEKSPEVDPYVSVSTDNHSYTNDDGETYQEIILNMERMERNSIRTAIVQDAELPSHTERDYTNRPYRKFAVIKDRDFWLNWKNDKNQWTFGSWLDYNNGQDVCPESYRMPNQRELMLMYINIPNNLESGMIWLDPDNTYNDPNDDLNDVLVGDKDMDKYTNRYYVCSTGYEYNNYYSDNRPGFMYDVWAGVLFLETNRNHNRGLVRCVRDVAE